MATGLMHDSVPPASTTSARWARIISVASPIACAPVAQAVATARLGPVMPYRIDASAAVAFAIIMGTRSGPARDGPRRETSATWSSRRADAPDT